MSTFTLRLIFDGICAYAPTGGNTLATANGMMVVLPDATLPANGRQALDGLALRQHLPFIRCELAHLASGLPTGGVSPLGDQPTAIWYLNRHRVTLDLTPDPGTGTAHFITSGDHRITHVPEAGKIVPDQVDAKGSGHHRIRDSVIGPDPPASALGDPTPGVIAQVQIGAGTIGSHERADQAEWRFRQTLSSSPYEGQFAARVAVTIENLTSAALHITSLDNVHNPIVLPLLSNGKPEVEVTIANACDDDPLQWPDLSEQQPSSGSITDDDLKWLFFLCQGRTAIGTLLTNTGRQLPVPVFKSKGGSTGGGGRKCFGCLFDPVP